MSKGKLHDGRLPSQIKTLIESGAEFTIAELADQFKVDRKRISSVLTGLRKKGFLYYPVGGVYQYPTGNGRPGVVLDVTQNQVNLVDTMERQRKVYIDPQLTSFARFVDEGMKNFPQMAPVLKGFLSDMMVHVHIAESELNSHATPKLTNK